MFKPGDRVVRTGASYFDVLRGMEYTVRRVIDRTSMELVEMPSSKTYMPEHFSLAKPAETDPTGRDPHSPGAKVDAGKAQFDYVLAYFPNALSAVNEVADYGAKKYTPGGWVTVPNGPKRYGNAMMRHHISRLGGEINDPATNLMHAAHAAWNALATLELLIKEQE